MQGALLTPVDTSRQEKEWKSSKLVCSHIYDEERQLRGVQTSIFSTLQIIWVRAEHLPPPRPPPSAGESITVRRTTPAHNVAVPRMY